MLGEKIARFPIAKVPGSIKYREPRIEPIGMHESILAKCYPPTTILFRLLNSLLDIPVIPDEHVENRADTVDVHNFAVKNSYIAMFVSADGSVTFSLLKEDQSGRPSKARELVPSFPDIDKNCEAVTAALQELNFSHTHLDVAGPSDREKFTVVTRADHQPIASFDIGNQHADVLGFQIIPKKPNKSDRGIHGTVKLHTRFSPRK